jgi:predicted unusual protein kinase regulating ubiquinone biosynthesis (AarF/ABC1/UbiB family)
MDGEEVAVKVQRPDLLFDVALDIYVLRIGVRICFPTQRL